MKTMNYSDVDDMAPAILEAGKKGNLVFPDTMVSTSFSEDGAGFKLVISGFGRVNTIIFKGDVVMYDYDTREQCINDLIDLYCNIR